jgi:tryptophan synthase beta subunit
VVINLSGRGDKDIEVVAAEIGMDAHEAEEAGSDD